MKELSEESARALLVEWDALRESYMAEARINYELMAERSRIAAAYEFCADGLRRALELPTLYD